MIPPAAQFGLREPLSVAGDGSWRISVIQDHTPVHFMVPVDGGAMAVLVSVDGQGNHTKSEPHACMPVIRGGRVAATTSFGPGPLIFLGLDADGKYYYDDDEAPAARFESVEEFIKAACASLRSPCPHWRHQLQPPGDDSSSKGLLNTPTLMDATFSICPQAGAITPPASTILARAQPDWGIEFYIRVDRGGSFHTYPDVGGPFQSIEQADKAIDQYLDDRRAPKMCLEQAGVSRQEMGMRRCLFWPDGTMKRRTKSYIFQKGHEHMCRLVCAVVDQYNEDHKLVADRKYELKHVTEQQSFHENKVWYHHLNFTANSEGFDKQFFVELKNTRKEGLRHAEWLVSCFCMVETKDNGYCKGCPDDVKHPNKTDAYSGGHVGPEEMLEDPDAWSDSDEDETSRERRIRRKYDVPRRPFVYPVCATPKPGYEKN